jgi:cell division protein FtsB
VEELEAVNQRVSQVAKEVAAKEAERAQLAAEVEALNKNISVSVG